MENILTWLKTPLTTVAGVPLSPGLIGIVVIVAWFVFKRR